MSPDIIQLMGNILIHLVANEVFGCLLCFSSVFKMIDETGIENTDIKMQEISVEGRHVACVVAIESTV